MGAVLCVFITSPYHSHLLLLLDQYDLPTFTDLDWASIEMEWTRIRSQIPEPWKLNKDGREFKVGESMAERGLKPEHPIVLVPGVISTACYISSSVPVFFIYFLHNPPIRVSNHGQLHLIIVAIFARNCGVVISMSVIAN